MSSFPSQERQDLNSQTRILNDAELLKNGAHVSMGRLVVTERQRQAAQREMLYEMWREARLYSQEPQKLEEDFLIGKDDFVNFALAGHKKIQPKQANKSWTAVNPSHKYWKWDNTIPSPGWNHPRILDKVAFKEETGLEAVQLNGQQSEDVMVTASSLSNSLLAGKLDKLHDLGPGGRAFIADLLSYKLFEQEYMKSQAHETSSVELMPQS